MNRQEKKREIFARNEIGKRLEFVRENLGVKTVRICEETGIPHKTYRDMEAGTRNGFYEEIAALVNYLDDLWMQRFADAYPSYQGVKISTITFSWLLLGDSPRISTSEEIKRLKSQFFKREYKLLEKISQLEGRK